MPAESPDARAVGVSSLPLTDIPHTTQLFADFLYNFDRVRSFYSRPPRLREWPAAAFARPDYTSERRQAVAAVLERQNRTFYGAAGYGVAGERALANIERLRQGAVAIVTGQQTALLGGPVFTLYKALTAIKVAAESTRLGHDAVPVFWMSSEDHDFAEISAVELPDDKGALHRLAMASRGTPDAPVGSLPLPEEIRSLLVEARTLLGEGAGTQAMTEALAQAYQPGATIASAFARLLAHWFAEFGLVLLDPADTELHRIGASIFSGAVEHAAELNAALLERGQQLHASGYHEQVKVTAASTLLFLLRDGARVPIKRNGEQFAAGEEELSTAQLRELAERCPEQLSANALLRPVLQDYLLPSVAMVAGPAEIAYMAQSAAVYQPLLGRLTPALPRFSATLLEPAVARLLDRYQISVPQLFSGLEATREALAQTTLPSDVTEAFDAAGVKLEQSLAEINARLERLDPTLLDAASNAGKKMQYQLEQLRAKAARAQLRRQDEVAAHAERLTSAIYPNRQPQERVLGGAYFMVRHRGLLPRLLEIISVDSAEHCVVRLGS